MTQVERSEAVKLAQSVLEELQTVGGLTVCADEGLAPASYSYVRLSHYPTVVQGHVAAALTCCRALLALLEKEAGGEGEGWRPSWLCEFCFKPADGTLPGDWLMTWQSAVCPECQKRVVADGGYHVVKGGAYAYARDPRPFAPAPPAQEGPE